MRVKAKTDLYVDLVFRVEGAIFDLENDKDFSERSMERVERTGGKLPARYTSKPKPRGKITKPVFEKVTDPISDSAA